MSTNRLFCSNFIDINMTFIEVATESLKGSTWKQATVVLQNTIVLWRFSSFLFCFYCIHFEGWWQIILIGNTSCNYKIALNLILQPCYSLAFTLICFQVYPSKFLAKFSLRSNPLINFILLWTKGSVFNLDQFILICKMIQILLSTVFVISNLAQCWKIRFLSSSKTCIFLSTAK